MSLRKKIAEWVLKSLYDLHPDFADREHVWRIWSDEEAEKPSSFQNYASDYSITAWVHVAVKKWQDAISNLPLGIVRGSKSVSHQLNDFLMHPNNEISSTALWRQWSADLALGGETGFEFVANRSGSRILEMWPHQPSRFSVQPDENLRTYYVPRGYHIEYQGVREYDLPADEFLHTKFYNPENPWRGISPMSAIRMSVAIEQLASAWSKMFFTNGARPDGIIIAPQGITKTEREEIENKFHERHGLTAKGVSWHKVAVLEQGVTDYKPINFTVKDMQWAETRKLSANEILAIFGIPDELGGLGRNTYENFERAHLVFWSETMLPLIQFRDAEMSFFFRRRGLLTGDERVQTDISGVSILNRLENPRYQLALWLFQMGVPFNRIEEFLHLGIGDIGPQGDLSFPFGSLQTVTPEGVALETTGQVDPEADVTVEDDVRAEEQADKILRVLKNRVKRNGVLV